VPDQQITKRK